MSNYITRCLNESAKTEAHVYRGWEVERDSTGYGWIGIRNRALDPYGFPYGDERDQVFLCPSEVHDFIDEFEGEVATL